VREKSKKGYNFFPFVHYQTSASHSYTACLHVVCVKDKLANDCIIGREKV